MNGSTRSVLAYLCQDRRRLSCRPSRPQSHPCFRYLPVPTCRKQTSTHYNTPTRQKSSGTTFTQSTNARFPRDAREKVGGGKSRFGFWGCRASRMRASKKGNSLMGPAQLDAPKRATVLLLQPPSHAARLGLTTFFPVSMNTKSSPNQPARGIWIL